MTWSVFKPTSQGITCGTEAVGNSGAKSIEPAIDPAVELARCFLRLANLRHAFGRAYLTSAGTSTLFALFHQLLKRDGLLVVDDVIPPEIVAAVNAWTLVRSS